MNSIKKGDKIKANRQMSKTLIVIDIYDNVITASDGNYYHITKVVKVS